MESEHIVAAPYWWAVPTVGAIGAVIAGWSVATNRRLARKKATLDLIEKIESTSYYAEIRKVFSDNLVKNDYSSRFTPALTEEDSRIRRLIIAYLNHNELIAIGCKHGILDADFYSEWMRSLYVSDWHSAKEFIFATRINGASPGSNASYIAFERLARRFELAHERAARVRRFKGYLHRWYSKIRRLPSQ